MMHELPTPKRAWLWQDGKWQVGKIYAIDDETAECSGMCRDYGDWGVPYPGSMPLETHGTWLPKEVAWKRPPEQYRR